MNRIVISIPIGVVIPFFIKTQQHGRLGNNPYSTCNDIPNINIRNILEDLIALLVLVYVWCFSKWGVRGA